MNETACMPPQAGVELFNQRIATSISNEVVILKVENGFVVRVGCKSFVAKSLGEIFDGLTLYYDKPDEAIKKYCSK